MAGVDKTGAEGVEGNQSPTRPDSDRPNQREDLDKEQKRFEDRLEGSHHRQEHKRKGESSGREPQKPTRRFERAAADQKWSGPGDANDLANSMTDGFQSPADRILSGLQGTASRSGDVSGVDHVKLNDLVGKLVNRILVAEPKPGQKEIHIMLNDSSLAGTEITLNRDPHGLSVTFVTPSDAAAQLLNSGLPALHEALQAHEAKNQMGRVALEVKTHDNRSNTDDSGDGRSRNRRDPRDEWEESN